MEGGGIRPKRKPREPRVRERVGKSGSEWSKEERE